MRLSDFKNVKRFEFVKDVTFKDNSINTIKGKEYLDLETGLIYQVAEGAGKYRVASDGQTFGMAHFFDEE